MFKSLTLKIGGCRPYLSFNKTISLLQYDHTFESRHTKGEPWYEGFCSDI